MGSEDKTVPFQKTCMMPNSSAAIRFSHDNWYMPRNFSKKHRECTRKLWDPSPRVVRTSQFHEPATSTSGQTMVEQVALWPWWASVRRRSGTGRVGAQITTSARLDRPPQHGTASCQHGSTDRHSTVPPAVSTARPTPTAQYRQLSAAVMEAREKPNSHMQNDHKNEPYGCEKKEGRLRTA